MKRSLCRAVVKKGKHVNADINSDLLPASSATLRVRSATNDCFLEYSISCLMSKMSENIVPMLKMTPSNIHCDLDIQFNVKILTMLAAPFFSVAYPGPPPKQNFFGVIISRLKLELGETTASGNIWDAI